jgi:hypothetical protein
MTTRKESTFSLVGADGVQRTYRVLNAVTVDDLALLGMKAAADVIANDSTYTSFLTREIRDYLVRSRVSLG